MSLEVALDLVLCGVFLAGSALVALRLHLELHPATLLAGLVGGGLCIVCGALGRRVAHCRASAVAVLAAVMCVLTCQSWHSWQASTAERLNGQLFAVLAALLAICASVLVNLIRGGKTATP